MKKLLLTLSMIAAVFSANAQMEKKINVNAAAVATINPNNGNCFYQLGGQMGIIAKATKYLYLGGGINVEQICDNHYTIDNKFLRVSPYLNLQNHIYNISTSSIYFDAKAGCGTTISDFAAIDSQIGGFYSVGLGVVNKTYVGFYASVNYKMETLRAKQSWLPVIDKIKYHGLSINLGYRF